MAKTLVIDTDSGRAKPANRLLPTGFTGWFMLFRQIGIALGIGFVGSLATSASLTDWYPALAKPWFNPPNWVFGPVWTTLFILMAYAAWRVGQLERRSDERRRALLLYSLQLALNLGWSIAFFGFMSPVAGLVVVVLLWAAIAATLSAFWRLDRLAGWLLVPYLAWVSFAAVLNGSIAALN